MSIVEQMWHKPLIPDPKYLLYQVYNCICIFFAIIEATSGEIAISTCPSTFLVVIGQRLGKIKVNNTSVRGEVMLVNKYSLINIV